MMREQGRCTLLSTSSVGQLTIMYFPKFSMVQFCFKQPSLTSNSTMQESLSIFWIPNTVHSTSSCESEVKFRSRFSTSILPTLRSSRQLRAYLVWWWRGKSGSGWWVPLKRQLTSWPLYMLKMYSPPGWMKFSSMQYMKLSTMMQRTPSSLQSLKFSAPLLMLSRIQECSLENLDSCLRGNLSIRDRVWIRYMISKMMKMNRSVPTKNSHDLKRREPEPCRGQMSRATMILPRRDIEMPTHRWMILMVNMSVLSFWETISQRTLKPRIIWTRMKPTRTQERTNSPFSAPCRQILFLKSVWQQRMVLVRTYMRVRREQIIMEMVWRLIMVGQDLAQRTRRRGMSTPTPQMEKRVMRQASSRSEYVRLDSKSIPIYYKHLHPSIHSLYNLSSCIQAIHTQAMDIDNEALIKALLAQNGIQMTMEALREPCIDRALGCMFGAMIGDALGAYAQFQPVPSKQMMDELMKMPGGGIFGLYPGQVTDDSQMALCLLQSLLLYNPQEPLSTQSLQISLAITHSYIAWMQSNPFDIGATCERGIRLMSDALKPMLELPYHIDSMQNKDKLRKMLEGGWEKVKLVNQFSISNGYLMRNFPLAIFKAFMKKYKTAEYQELQSIIDAELKVTHSHAECIESSHQFIDTMSSLIIRSSFADIKTIYNQVMKKKSTIQSWNEEARKNTWMDATKQIGWAKIAYTFSFKNLSLILQDCKSEQDLTPELFSKIMRSTIERGGDTDTNAAIVGAMMGAVFGFSKLPQAYIHKMLSLKLLREQFEKVDKIMAARPPFFEPKNGLIKVLQLAQKFRSAKA